MVLRLSSDFRRAMDLSLVLEQEGIRHELRRVDEAHWTLVVDDADATRAESALAGFEQENPREMRLPERVHPVTGAAAAGGALALALVTFYLRTGPESAGSPWFERGSADAAAILRGEWWRAVTALTLHADAGHVAGNAVLGGLLLALLGRSVGPGMASVLMLLSGVAGTVTTAALLRHDFVSIGASTAVFGALGVLAALPRASRRVWMPVVGGLALLALLGTSKRADVAGHLCGFVCGVLAGAAVRGLPPLWNRAAQACLAILATSVPVVAWVVAFR
ncbi:MAG TPA: rhomboid family intramembrane serine protease [Myxococcaceae bacterium]|nr:rhomboid family intramembrane serine protease [Myxococcaceae bacterium]